MGLALAEKQYIIKKTKTERKTERIIQKNQGIGGIFTVQSHIKTPLKGALLTDGISKMRSKISLVEHVTNTFVKKKMMEMAIL